MAKGGPPYLQKPDGTYLVIGKPWPASRNSISSFANNVGAWLRFIGRPPHWSSPRDDVLCDVIYHRRSEDTIIVHFPDDIDVTPYVGAHNWVDFLKPNAISPENSMNVSYIFKYNYRNNGDPWNHNWSDTYPTADPPPPVFPIKHPYPRPGYARRPDSLITLARAMPEPVDQPKAETLNAVESGKEHEDRKPVIKKEPTGQNDDPKHPVTLMNKADPYEAEEAATQFLRSSGPPIKNEPDDINRLLVKKEDQHTSGSYTPSKAYLQAFATLPSGRLQGVSGLETVTVKAEEDQRPILPFEPEYQPSPSLVDAVHRLQASNRAAGERALSNPVKTEPVDPSPSFPTHRTRDPRKRPHAERNRNDDGLQKRIKTEEM